MRSGPGCPDSPHADEVAFRSALEQKQSTAGAVFLTIVPVDTGRLAERLGFTFEGVFRQHIVIKGQNRETAWFSMLDYEWPARKAAFEA